MLNVFFFIIGVICAIVPIFVGVYNNRNKYEYDDNQNIKINKVLFAVLSIVFIILSMSFSIIPTGYTGVRTTFGQIDEVTVPNGFNWKIPVAQKIEFVNNKQQDITYDDKIWSETLERTAIYYAGTTVTYQINPEKSAWIYANVSDYTRNLITQSIIASSVKTSSKTLSDIDATNRGKIEPLVSKNLQSSLDQKYGENTIIINKVVINAADFDKTYNEAIAAKQEAQLISEKSEIENQRAIAKAKADAEVKITEAQAEADAKLIRAKGEADANEKLNKTLSKEILRSRYIDKWDGVLPKVVSGNGESYLININDDIDSEDSNKDN